MKPLNEQITALQNEGCSARPFLRRLNNAKANWLQIAPEEAVAGIGRLIRRL